MGGNEKVKLDQLDSGQRVKNAGIDAAVGILAYQLGLALNGHAGKVLTSAKPILDKFGALVENAQSLNQEQLSQAWLLNDQFGEMMRRVDIFNKGSLAAVGLMVVAAGVAAYNIIRAIKSRK